MTGQNVQTSNSISPQKETKFNLTNASPEARQMVFEILSIKTRKKIPDLLAEGLEMLEAKYGKV